MEFMKCIDMLGVRKLKLCLDKKTITYSESNKDLETMHVFGDNFQTIEILGSSGKVFKALLRREYNFYGRALKTISDLVCGEKLCLNESMNLKKICKPITKPGSAELKIVGQSYSFNRVVLGKNIITS